MAYAGIYIEFFDSIRPPQWLPQLSLSSLTKLHHTASRTLLTQTFINPSAVAPIPSARYSFPLYESCAVVAFRCYVGKRLIEGIIKEKEEASATYRAAAARNEIASLLEQHAADVFSTDIGNIPAGATVKVEIEYIMELKHDAEVDGLRFIIPTSIAPRYGTSPAGLAAGYPTSAVTAKNMNISVQISMSSSIQSVQSPSHPIALHLGGHSTDTPDNAFNPQHALATLGQTTTELDKDFILLIKCASLSSPAALLEEHPSIPNSKALMLTLVPKFNLPKSTKPEVVFIVDRSGSMASRVAPLKSSLSVFLKSLPVDVNFNICSFGSHHSFLWDKSRPYSNQSFTEAQKYCDHIKADFGGTEILPAVKSTIEKRLKDLNLEIMVLTDGAVWNTEELFKYVDNETKKGDVRLFSLGIGRDVSHALIDGLARVGRGFSQVVADEKEGMESKVARMLRGGLSAHVVNYRLEWEGKPSTEAVPKPPPVARTARRFGLFDSQANPDLPVSFSDSPDFVIPSVMQAPYKIQPLFPFSRSTAYAILSSDTRPPSHVWLRGTTPEGDELELEIAVQAAAVQKEETIHQLAARKILQELKDGTGYVHDAVDGERQPGLLADWVKKEGVRVGLKYGVASQWTSFVAVERKEEEKEKEEEVKKEEEVESPPSALDDDSEDWDTLAEHNSDDSDETYSRSRSSAPGQPGGGSPVSVMMMMAPPPPPIPYPTTRKHSTISYGRGEKNRSVSSRSISPPLSTFDSYSSNATLVEGGGSKKTDDGYLRSRGGAGSMAKHTLSANLPTPAAPRMRQLGLSSPAPDSSTLIGINPTGMVDGSAMRFRSQVPPPVMPAFVSGSTSSGSSAQPAPSGMFSMFGGGLGSIARTKGKKGPAVVANQADPPAPTATAAAPMSFGSSLLMKSQDEYSLAAPRFQEYSKQATPMSSHKIKTAPSIGISYSPSSAPPPERLSAADTPSSAQPLSSQTKALIGLQTFGGSFVLDSALAQTLGVALAVLEARLSVLEGGGSASGDLGRRAVWATVLAVKMFETRLVGERGVWQLVVDKARAWLGGVGGLDMEALEKMAGEVLGV